MIFLDMGENKPRKPKSHLCRWNCGEITKNRSGICNTCWTFRNDILKKRLIREASKPKKTLSEQHKAKIKAARIASPE